jgi:hypothetical protein
MPQPPTTERLTAGEKRLADLIDSTTTPRPSPSEKTAASRPRVDVVWNADTDPQGHGAG